MELTVKEKHRLLERYGAWAIVTGATSGIGLEIAIQLASAGFNLIINARGAERLLALENSLRVQYGVDVIAVAADLATAAGVEQLVRAVNGKQIGLLVASAGYGTSGLFTDSSLHAEVDMLRVNCEAVLSLVHYFSMRFCNAGRGGIVLLSSIVAFQGVPYAAHYAATKAYIQSLAEGLNAELKLRGVDVLAACPGPVRSGFGRRANMQMNMSLTPSQIGIPILNALGRRSIVLPGLLSKLLTYALRTVPRSVKVKLMQGIMGGMTKHQRVKG
ncbi:short-chain dehydrogenase [Chitinophagaceae bacterium IBVUCB1]|nr:short-chain dehydrogenase [Chitinophagaceae bacterium IBVUCB1]